MTEAPINFHDLSKLKTQAVTPNDVLKIVFCNRVKCCLYRHKESYYVQDKIAHLLNVKKKNLRTAVFQTNELQQHRAKGFWSAHEVPHKRLYSRTYKSLSQPITMEDILKYCSCFRPFAKNDYIYSL